MTRQKYKTHPFIYLLLAAALVLTAAFVVLPSAGGVQAFAQTNSEAEETQPTKAPLSKEGFAKARPELLTSRCRGTSTGIAMEWREVPGAKEYQIWRAEKKDGEYSKFASTEELKLKAKADGDYYYRMRAVRGKETSLWSMTVQLYCVSGYVEKMYYGEDGFTHFKVRVSNHTDQPVYFLGTGLYTPFRRAHYQVEKYDLETGDKEGKPFPMTAYLSCSVNGSVKVPAQTDQKKLDVWVPMKLPMLGETGMRSEIDLEKEEAVLNAATNPESEYGNELQKRWFGYRVGMLFYPNMDTPAFALNVTEQEKGSKAPARIVR